MRKRWKPPADDRSDGSGQPTPSHSDQVSTAGRSGTARTGMLGSEDRAIAQLWKTRERHIGTKNRLWKNLWSTCGDARRAPADLDRTGTRGGRPATYPQGSPQIVRFPDASPQAFPQRRAESMTYNLTFLTGFARYGGSYCPSEVTLMSVRCPETIEASRGMDGAEAQTRTGDTRLFRAVLYQLSYLGTVAGTTGFEPAISGVTIQRPRPD
jgi:hypothetical protein